MAPSMLPDNLVGALKRYKEDTNSVAAWLASTAKHYGYKSQTAEPSDKDAQQKPPGRLKGKARKEAKSQASGSKNETDQRYIVALDDYVPMAKYIATHRRPTIQVPMSLISTMNRVIDSRSSFRARMMEYGINVDENANKNHLYFVRVLETVRETLRPNMKEVNKQMSAEPAKSRGVIEGFSILALHEPSQSVSDAPDIERPKQMAQDSAIYQAEERDSLDDALVTWDFLLVDAGIIRNQIAWVWKGYCDGTFDLTVASVVTDTGIHMVESLVDQSLELFSKHGGCIEVARTYFCIKATQQGYSLQEIDKCWKGRCADPQLFELFNTTFSHVFTILEPLSTMFPNPRERTLHASEMMSELKTRCGVPGSDATTLELSVDQFMAAQFWNEALVFAMNRRECGVIDKFSVYVFDASQDHVVSFQLAFACQVHLDVFHLMREDLPRGSSEFYKHAKYLRDQLQGYVASISRPGSPAGPSNVDESVGGLIQHFNTILGYCEPQEGHANRGKGARLQSEETFKIFNILPAFSGLYLFRARVDAASMALRLIKNDGVVTVMVHLHNAMQQLQMLKTPWVDMETFQKCFEERDLFFATKPVSRKDFIKHLMVQLGFPPSALKIQQGSKPREPRELFKSFTPEIQGVAPVSMIFIGIVHKRVIPDLSWDDLDYVLSANLFKELTTNDGAHVLVPLALEERKQVKNRFSKPKSKDRQQSAPLSPDQQLRQFALALAGESRELAFPYMEMHTLCLSLFSNISDRCASTLETLDLSIDPLEKTLNVIVRIIALASMKHEVVPLREAAGVVEEHINTNSGILTEKIANVGTFGSMPIPSFELYKAPRAMFVKISADTRPVDEVIVIPFEERDSTLTETDNIE